jgi:putative FmdB family regulatory protein
MPTYEYICRACGHNFEIYQLFTDDTLTICPSCGGELRKVFGAPTITFKGSGFYATDNRKGSGGEKSGGEKKKPDGSKETSTSGEKGSSSDASSSGSSRSSGESSGSTPAEKTAERPKKEAPKP